jgi:hypothetical protein
LRAAGADRVPHTGTTLFAHLRGVHVLLRRWGLREPLCAAGLFHSVYGTELFDHSVLGAADRNRVRALIGSEAESLVWIWHVVERRTLEMRRAGGMALRRDGGPLPLTDREFRDVVDLMIADALEHLPRGQDPGQWLKPWLPLASPPVAAAAAAFLRSR